MPEKETLKRARADKRAGKAPSTQAGEFIREEFHHVREGKHGARSPEQVIAIGLSKARRAGVKLRPPRRGRASAETREQAARDSKEGQEHPRHRPSPRRSRAVRRALEHEGHAAASPAAASQHSRRAARRRSPTERHEAAMKAARSRTHAQRSASAKKAARTRARKSGASSRSHAKRGASARRTGRTPAASRRS